MGLIEIRHHFRQVAHAENVNALRDGGFGGVIKRNQKIRNALAAGADGDGERATHRPQSAIERQLAHQHVLIATADGSHRAQDSESHGQIETRAFLAHIGGCKIDGDGFVGVTETGIKQRALDTFPAFAHRCVGHADGDEIARVAAGVHVHLDVNQVRFYSKDSRATGPEKGHSPGSGYSTENVSRVSYIWWPRLSRTASTMVYFPSGWSFARFRFNSPGW